MQSVLKACGVFGAACLAAMLWSGCSSATAPLVTDPTTDDSSAIVVPPPTLGPISNGAGELQRETPVTPDRGGSAIDFSGKWFGDLAEFDPAEPSLNSWNIDLNMHQEGTLIDAVVIMSELIPIGPNIWDVHIRLDASTEGQWHDGGAHLFLFNNVTSAPAAPFGVIVGNTSPTRDMEYVEIILRGIVNNALDGEMVIHWRDPIDRNRTWTQTCSLSEVSPVQQ
ncbi:MAG: hypothetical protein ABI743_11035 [bacterium]